MPTASLFGALQRTTETKRQKEQEIGWHPDIINWQGVSDVEFEIDLDRDFLKPSREDVF